MPKKNTTSKFIQNKQFMTPALLLVLMAGVAVAFVIIRSRATSFTTVSVPSSIASDCSVDVQSPLNSWLAAQGNYTIIEFRPNGCYLVQDQLQIANKSNFVLHGNNATIKRTLADGTLPRTNHIHFHLNLDNYLTVQNLNIQGIKQDSEGYNSGREGQHGFGLWAVQHAVFDNVKISNIYGDCFYFNGNPTQSSNSQFITVQNSLCHQSGRHGAAFLAANDILITHSTIAGRGIRRAAGNRTTNRTIFRLP